MPSRAADPSTDQAGADTAGIGAAGAGAQRVVARRYRVTGRVQGVGFRPFVHRLASRLRLAGWVRNDADGVAIEAQGPVAALDAFARALVAEAPPLAQPRLAGQAPACPSSDPAADFRVLASAAGAARSAHIPPDTFACADCLAEMADPSARHHRHPFITCTQCGPRYTVIRRLPYDRARTTLAGFALCDACAADYRTPTDRRFHAEPLACPHCGPTLSFRDRTGTGGHGPRALDAAIAALAAGRIVAVKGVGGYHLMLRATDDAAVARLRAAKHRPDKPLAVMFRADGADGLDAVRRHLVIDRQGDRPVAAALAGPARPIVLLPRRASSALSPGIAPGLDEIGAFLPASPLHHLLLDALDVPLVATSGNIAGAPVLTDADEAEARLGRVADAFLHHDRPIARPADDSVLRPVAGRLRPLRLGRGLAPVEIDDLPTPLATPVLALGGQMKATLAVGWGRRLVVGPHVGDLDSVAGLDRLTALAADLPALYGVTPERLIVDAHPGYASHRWARRQGLPVATVPHHHAHAAALALERPAVRRWLVLAWDGLGLGVDGTLWGGEALVGRPGAWHRVGSWRPFHPVGGEAAARAPWRSAAALCWAVGRPFDAPGADAALAREAWGRGLNCPATSAVGRLFDAAACLILGLTEASHEGHAPMALEAAAAGGHGTVLTLAMAPDAQGCLRLDWAPLVPVLADAERPRADRAATLHATLAAAACTQAATLAAAHGAEAVGLTGGVFQNRRLAEAVIAGLEARGLTAVLPERLPVNDGGLAAGQVVEAAARQRPATARPARPGLNAARHGAAHG
ncbi:carbamoyltransferase HypF [Rhodothalassium salexigens]|nr:carbamoyltransferase HypF [Rhodothalassium salexigens]MBK5911113.1 carbamoyltransferase HypF [Rhodothalassium salexigens]MBK5919469.1 carbamoyltransferase HypF [Rhodothalassium salexigens]